MHTYDLIYLRLIQINDDLNHILQLLQEKYEQKKNE